jgi:hypothetical protein
MLHLIPVTQHLTLPRVQIAFPNVLTSILRAVTKHLTVAVNA